MTTGHVPYGVANESMQAVSSEQDAEALVPVAGSAQEVAVRRACAALEIYPSAATRDAEFAIIRAQLSDEGCAE